MTVIPSIVLYVIDDKVLNLILIEFVMENWFIFQENNFYAK